MHRNSPISGLGTLPWSGSRRQIAITPYNIREGIALPSPLHTAQVKQTSTTQRQLEFDPVDPVVDPDLDAKAQARTGASVDSVDPVGSVDSSLDSIVDEADDPGGEDPERDPPDPGFRDRDADARSRYLEPEPPLAQARARYRQVGAGSKVEGTEAVKAVDDPGPATEVKAKTVVYPVPVPVLYSVAVPGLAHRDQDP